MKTAVTSLVLLLATATLWPRGDAAELNVLGFSPDGQHFAFESYGVIDGGPVPWAQLTVLRIPDNRWVVRPFYEEDASDVLPVDSLRQRVHLRADSVLREIGITSGNTGAHLISHRFTDTGVDPHHAQFAVGMPGVGQYHELYDLVLTETEDGTCENFGPRKRLRLTVQRVGAAVPQVLQADTYVPASRGCPVAYRIAEVYLYREQYLVVLLNMMVPGFEGRSMRYLAVSGVLDRGTG